MLNAFFSRIILIIVSLLYPAYASFRSVRNRSIEDHTSWMIYWMILAPLICLQQLTDSILFWFPCYYDLKVALVLYLLPIRVNGSASLYYKMVQPVLEYNEHEFSSSLKQFGEQGFYSIMDFLAYIADGVLSLITDAVHKNWLHEKKENIVKYMPAMARNILPDSVRMLMNELDHDFGLGNIWHETENKNEDAMNAIIPEPQLYEKPNLIRGRSRERRIHNTQQVYTQTNKENIPYISPQADTIRSIPKQNITAYPLLHQQQQQQHVLQQQQQQIPQQRRQPQPTCGILKEHNSGYQMPNVLPTKISPLKLLNKQLSCILNEATKFNEAQSAALANNHSRSLHRSTTSVAPTRRSTSKNNRPTVSRQRNATTSTTLNNNNKTNIRPTPYRERTDSSSRQSSPIVRDHCSFNRTGSYVLGNSATSRNRQTTPTPSYSKRNSLTNRKSLPLCKDTDESATERLVEYVNDLKKKSVPPLLSVPRTISATTPKNAIRQNPSKSRDPSTDRRDRSLSRQRERKIPPMPWRTRILKEIQTQTQPFAARHPLIAKNMEKRTTSPVRSNSRSAYLGRQRTLRA